MRIVKRLGLVLLTVCAFSALAVASASAAPLFLAHPPGGLLLAKAGGVQKLVTAGGTIECTAVKLIAPDDVAPATLRSLSITVAVAYSGCKAFGLAATVHPVRYRIDANGLVTLLNTVLVLAGGGTCTVTIPAEKNQSLTTVLFSNNAATRGILLTTDVTKVTSSGAGAACTYAEESNGTTSGTIHVTYDSSNPLGVIRWDA